jgi:hypothetical protein
MMRLHFELSTAVTLEITWKQKEDEPNIKIDLEIIWKGVDWIHVVQNADQRRTVVNTAMRLQVP